MGRALLAVISVGLLVAPSCSSSGDGTKAATGSTGTTGSTATTKGATGATGTAEPTSSTSTPAPPDTAPCAGPNGVGGPVPAGSGPGDLIAANDLTAANSTSPGFPTGARVWRILYVSTGIDERDLQLICGTVAAPTAGPKTFGRGGRLLNWTHGTVGLSQSCLPSSDPATLFWGSMAGGINAIAWGKDAGEHQGDPAGGLLQYAMNQGMVVSATDYQPTDTYVIAKIAGSNALDAARAATQLVSGEFAGQAPTAYDMFTWGHSQGGHAALWTGQLAETYLAATKPSKPTATLNLIGVAALAPASNFITLPDQPGVQPGDGLADWEMHQNVGLDVRLETLQVQIGPALFSYIFGSWNQISNGPAPAVDAAFPAFPRNAAPLDMKAVVTPMGIETVDGIQPLCLAGDGAKAILKLAAPYFDAKTNQMLIPPVWNLPTDYKSGTYFKGALDQTCATTTDTGVAKWCTWMKWNIPGPLGTSPFPKAPIVAGKPVPVLIAQGEDDNIIHCIAPDDTPKATVPGPADCMSRALFDSLSSAVYCPAGGSQGHLELDTFRKIDLESPASHNAIPGQISAKGGSKSKADLVFDGSPLQKFMAAAFDKTSSPGCTSQVMNP